MLNLSLIDKVLFFQRFARRWIEKFLFQLRMNFQLGASLIDDFFQLFSVLFRIELLRLAEGSPHALVIRFQFFNDFGFCRRIISTCHFSLLRGQLLAKRRELLPVRLYLRRMLALSKPHTVHLTTTRTHHFLYFSARNRLKVTYAACRTSAFITRLRYDRARFVSLVLTDATQSCGITSA